MVMEEAYGLAYDSPGTIVTDIEVHKPELVGLAKGKV